MKGSTTFPPGASWIPVAVALVIVALISTLALSPQYKSRFLVGNGRTALTQGGTHKETRTQVVNGKSQQVQVDVPNTDSGGRTMDVVSGGDAGSAGTQGTAGTAGSGDTVIDQNGNLVGGGGTSCDPNTDPSCISSGGGGSGGGGGGTAGGGGGGSGGGSGCDPNTDPTCGSSGGGGGSGGSGGSSGGGGGTAAITCDQAGNGGATDTGVSQSEIHLASTVVTDGTGGSFLKEAQQGIQAALDEANRAGGVCGRRVTIEFNNSSWDRTKGSTYISNYVNSGHVFALVAEPDSEGLAGAIDSGTIDQAGIPVVGTDGMLKDQYHDPWVWPVSASTVTNAHIVVDYACNHEGAKSFGVVYDSHYRFGAEGADAFAAQVSRCPGATLKAKRPIDGTQYGGYSTDIAAFNGACSPCDAVLMLLEPSAAQQWMRLEGGSWYKKLYGGEPLFNSQFAASCDKPCGDAPMRVWTGYHPAIAPFNDKDRYPGVYAYQTAIQSKGSYDASNEFTEGAYLGTKLFLEAAKRLGQQGKALTRGALRDELNSDSFDFGLTDAPISYSGQSLHLANTKMAMFAENFSGSFNGWAYQSTGYIPDPSPGAEQ